jgi:phosphoenolpyruvate-protein kinase (PTS system EI component)
MSRRLAGSAAAPGVAIGPALRLAGPVAAASVPVADAAAEAASALAALAGAADELDATAARLRAGGHAAEAEIVEAGALMARDPLLQRGVRQAVEDGGLPAAGALLAATGEHAQVLASLPDATLAARADDIRSLGRRAARRAAGGEDVERARVAGAVLVADDLGPADVADLDGVAAIALSAGATTAHAAIVARSLGVPMVVGLSDAVLDAASDMMVLVDGDAGTVTLDPAPAEAAAAGDAMAAAAARREQAARERGLAAVTRDGRALRVLTNAAGAAEVRAGLAAGADGVGLLRTELAFLEAGAWPSEDDHRRLLDAVAGALPPGATLTVRLLDFGGDKTPPFLAGVPERGIALLLAHPAAFEAQLRAIAAVAAGVDLRVLLPLVTSVDEVDAVRAALPPGTAVGAMVETPGAAAIAPELAQRCAFLSIGTNDLTHATLGSDRFSARDGVAHDPRVLREIARTAAAAAIAGIPLEVCGEAASDAVAMPLLVGLGVDELSVGAARVGEVRAWVRGLDGSAAREVATTALGAPDAHAVASLVEAALGARRRAAVA